MWQHTTKRNRCANKGIQFFVASDRELEMSWRDTLDFEVFSCVAGELEDFCSEVFKNCGYVDGGWERICQ